MATPSQKSEQIEEGMKQMFGFDRRESIKADVCVPEPLGCGEPITGFKDELSKKEFTISGLCQKCQDKVFGE